MLKIDISFKLKDLDFAFKAEVKRGEPYKFDIGEQVLADKLFGVLCGLDKDFKGTIDGDGICFDASKNNNVLALGDRTMFIRGSVYKNIYKALRLRAARKTAKIRTDEVIGLYKLGQIAKTNIKFLGDGELMRIAAARAHFRTAELVVIKNYDKIDLSNRNNAYIIIIV